MNEWQNVDTKDLEDHQKWIQTSLDLCSYEISNKVIDYERPIDNWSISVSLVDFFYSSSRWTIQKTHLLRLPPIIDRLPEMDAFDAAECLIET